MNVWATFAGGPLDGADETLTQAPDRLVFSSAQIGNDWRAGPFRVCDTIYDLATLSIDAVQMHAHYQHRT